ncbi:unnamed protein product [marine sediment metagenome]|uniref:Uncharacterized protein n=1 Tax=marine sediment metagenome TaxID=412755 RepID=X1EMD8_9ZZZZ
MPSKQQEFYAQLRQETEFKVGMYKDFQTQIESLKARTQESIKTLQIDMKFIAKQIESNNQMLNMQGVEPVKFDK